MRGAGVRAVVGGGLDPLAVEHGETRVLTGPQHATAAHNRRRRKGGAARNPLGSHAVADAGYAGRIDGAVLRGKYHAGAVRHGVTEAIYQPHRDQGIQAVGTARSGDIETLRGHADAVLMRQAGTDDDLIRGRRLRPGAAGSATEARHNQSRCGHVTRAHAHANQAVAVGDRRGVGERDTADICGERKLHGDPGQRSAAGKLQIGARARLWIARRQNHRLLKNLEGNGGLFGAARTARALQRNQGSRADAGAVSGLRVHEADEIGIAPGDAQLGGGLGLAIDKGRAQLIAIFTAPGPVLGAGQSVDRLYGQGAGALGGGVHCAKSRQTAQRAGAA